MSGYQEYIKFEDLVSPQYPGVNVDIDYARTTKNDGPLFDYIKSCSKPNVVWGSEKPVVEKCLPNHLQMEGESCNQIWNNSTKRKSITIVDYKYPK
jgi:hypothetical protein